MCSKIAIEKRVTWNTTDDDYADEDRWEPTDYTSYGFYGYDYAKEEALGALADAIKDGCHPPVQYLKD